MKIYYMRGYGTHTLFYKKVYLYLTLVAIILQYIGGGYMKITNILSRTLCIYDRQVPNLSQGGAGGLFWGSSKKIWELRLENIINRLLVCSR
jgi:hypothetical protein